MKWDTEFNHKQYPTPSPADGGEAVGASPLGPVPLEEQVRRLQELYDLTAGRYYKLEHHIIDLQYRASSLEDRNQDYSGYFSHIWDALNQLQSEYEFEIPTQDTGRMARFKHWLRGVLR